MTFTITLWKYLKNLAFHYPLSSILQSHQAIIRKLVPRLHPKAANVNHSIPTSTLILILRKATVVDGPCSKPDAIWLIIIYDSEHTTTMVTDMSLAMWGCFENAQTFLFLPDETLTAARHPGHCSSARESSAKLAVAVLALPWKAFCCEAACTTYTATCQPPTLRVLCGRRRNC